MATINLSITVPDGVATDVLDAFARAEGWTPASPATKANFARQAVADYVIMRAKAWRKHNDRDTAEAAATTATSGWTAS